MDRGLREFRIRGLSTNLQFVENVINHPDFAAGTVTTRFIDTTPELFHFIARKDRATKLLMYLGDVIVNGRPDVKGRLDGKRKPRSNWLARLWLRLFTPVRKKLFSPVAQRKLIP